MNDGIFSENIYEKCNQEREKVNYKNDSDMIE